MKRPRSADRTPIPTVGEWIGSPFPADAPFQATPEAMVELMDKKKVPWHLQELLRRLLARARLDNVVQIARFSIAGHSAAWSTNRKTLWRWLRALEVAGFITYSESSSGHGPTIGMEPLRIALREHADRGRHGLRDETGASQQRDERSHPRDDSSQRRDGASHAQPQDRRATETETEAEDGPARSDLQGKRAVDLGPVDPFLAALIEAKRPTPTRSSGARRGAGAP